MASADGNISTQYASMADLEAVIRLSERVQAALTSSGSLQQFGPLSEKDVCYAIVRRSCFVLCQDTPEAPKLIGCALVKSVTTDYFPDTEGFQLASYSSPWLYMHSVMLDPGWQGRGIGSLFVSDVVKYIKSDLVSAEVTLFLDCWAGDSRLRRFYTKMDFGMAAVVPKYDFEVARFYRRLVRGAGTPEEGGKSQGPTCS